MSIFLQIFWIAVGGALGGLAQFLSEFAFGPASSEKTSDLKKGCFAYMGALAGPFQGAMLVLQAIVIGICGALALQFTLILLGSHRTGMSPQDQLFILSISAAAGFGARRLLPKLASQLENKVDKIEKENADQQKQIDEQKKTLDEQSKTIEEQNKRLEETTRAAEENKDKADEYQLFLEWEGVQKQDTAVSMVFSCIDALKLRFEREPDARRYAFRIGRLYKVVGDYSTALATMDRFLKALDNDSARAKDRADAFYNKACYLTLTWSASKSKEGKLKALALEFLQTSLANPKNKADAWKEDDLDFLRTEALDEFVAVVGKKEDAAAAAHGNEGSNTAKAGSTR